MDEDLQVSVALQLSMDSARNVLPMNPKEQPNPNDGVNVTPALTGGRQEDDDINRLVSNDDTKSVVSQWGRRTDQGSETHKENVANMDNDERNELNVAIRDYVGDYEEAWPLLLEPDSDFCMVAGQITRTLELRNLGSRMSVS